MNSSFRKKGYCSRRKKILGQPKQKSCVAFSPIFWTRNYRKIVNFQRSFFPLSLEKFNFLFLFFFTYSIFCSILLNKTLVLLNICNWRSLFYTLLQHTLPLSKLPQKATIFAMKSVMYTWTYEHTNIQTNTHPQLLK